MHDDDDGIAEGRGPAAAFAAAVAAAKSSRALRIQCDPLLRLSEGGSPARETYGVQLASVRCDSL